MRRGLVGLGILLALADPAWADPPAEPSTRALVDLVALGREEAALTRVARTRATRTPVRAYAARIASDLQLVERRVLGAVGRPVPGARREMAEAVRALKGVRRQEFDVAFLAAMEVRHARAVGLATDALALSTPTPSRELLARLLPLLRQHVRLARLVEAVA